jgi:hypothetical protein
MKLADTIPASPPWLVIAFLVLAIPFLGFGAASTFNGDGARADARGVVAELPVSLSDDLDGSSNDVLDLVSSTSCCGGASCSGAPDLPACDTASASSIAAPAPSAGPAKAH